MPRQLPVLACALAIGLSAPACSQQPSTPEAAASTNPLADLARAAKFIADPVEPKDFVKKSRPASTEFLPIGITPKARDTKVKTPAELNAMEQELDAARAVHDRLSGRKPAAKIAKQPIAGAPRTQ